jgi:hypothetical protein
VDEGDLEIDAAIVQLLGRERPGDAILSEESGPTGEAPRRWNIDPLDAAALATPVPSSPDFLVDLLEGRIDVLLSQGGEVWDHAAEVAVVEAAGGRFRDPRGGHQLDLGLSTPKDGVSNVPYGGLRSRGDEPGKPSSHRSLRHRPGRRDIGVVGHRGGEMVDRRCWTRR